MLLMLALLLAAAPQGQVISVGELEANGVTEAHVAAVRDAVVLELKAQGYEASTDSPPSKRVQGVVNGSVMLLKGVFDIGLRIRDVGSNRILAASHVRCGAVDQLSAAAREAAAQLAREAREQWGVRAKFKPK